MKPNSTSVKALKSLKTTYDRKHRQKYLQEIFTAAFASTEADNWPSHIRGEVFIFYNKLRKMLI